MMHPGQAATGCKARLANITTMPRPILATVHLPALRHNLERLQRAAPDSRLWAVVKANAYGHGIERAFPALRAADGFALLDLAEAERLRGLDWRGPILLLEGCFEARDLELCSRLNLWHVVHCEEQIDWLAAHKTHQPHRVFLKMNSGMNRLGFQPSALRSAWARLNALPQVDEISLVTHFSDADSARFGADGIAHQLESFAAVTRDLPGERSLGNSAAALRFGEQAGVRADWVRPGIALYGSSPDFPARDIAQWDLAPTMTLATRLIGVQQLQAGDSVGYGSTFVADGALRIGIAACGYADGYPRHCPTGTPVLVDGVRTRTLGRVTMDMMMVDLRPVPNAQIGDPVVLWGEGLPVEEIARAAGTISWELLCGVSQRVAHDPR